jgi:hypothetical protein
MLNIKTFRLPSGREIKLEEVKQVTNPKRDWRKFLAGIFGKNDCMYFEIVLRNGTVEKVYSDASMVRYRTLMLFLSENGRMDTVD